MQPSPNPWLILVSLCTFFTACGKQTSTRAQTSVERDTAVVSAEGSRSVDERRADLLNRIRTADPDKATIERALLNERNELGLILSRQTNLDDVPKLLKAMLVQMDHVFPGEDHVAIAYAPTNPPRTIGTARSDARTRDITYTPAISP